MISLTRPICPNPATLATNYKYPENKSALRLASADKCMYCESKISHIDHAHVEHIRPKAQGKYPHLEFSWDNLGYSCPKCNINKGDKFHEETPYINPYAEDPSDHVAASGSFLYQRRGSERGEITIRDIDLNRPELLERRLLRIEEIKNAVSACFRTKNPALRDALLNELRMEALPDKEFSSFIKAFLEQQL